MTDETTRFIERDGFARYVGVEVLHHGPGTARARLDIQPHHLNSAGTVHGGAIFSLADAVFAIASNSHGPLAMAINVSISYFHAATSGSLVAEAQEVSLAPKLATYLVSVTDDAGRRIALFQGTVYRKSERAADRSA